MLVAAMNPCPCGYYGDPIKPCTCAPSTITKYRKRISGPLLDRIDIHIEVPRVDYQKLSSDRLGQSSDAIRKRVQTARDRQTARFTNPDSKKIKHELTDVVSKADMRVADIRQFCKLDESGESLIRAAMGQMNLSARGYHRVLKLARTIADLAGSEQIQSVHLAEALQYRPRLTI
jgi:magnesium chelatase family protein